MESSLTITYSIITFLYVAFRSDIKDVFTITQINESTFTLGREPLERRVCQRICHFQKWIVFLTYSTVISCYLFLMIFYLVNVWVNDAYTVTLGSAIFWFGLFPPYILYMAYGN